MIVIDNTNLFDWEYVRFARKAQKEHYFVSIVALPPPDEVQTAVERSHFDVNDDEMTQMLAKWQPFSPHRLMDKSRILHGNSPSSKEIHKRISPEEIGGYKNLIASRGTEGTISIIEKQADEEED